jgi:ribose/xylose/arabinose/galactoside ABC-type transport system permease subunit
VVAAVGVGALVGLVSGLITTLVGVPSFITTLGVLGVANGTALQLTEGQSIYGFPTDYQWLGQGDVGTLLPASVIFAFALLIVLQFMLSFTRLGLKIYAVGGNRRAADAVGMNAKRVKVTALVISGSAAAFAGVLVSARLDAANPNIGTFDLLDAIAAVVIGGVALSGGVGSVVGTATGVLLIVSIRNGLTLHGVTPFLQTAAVGAIIIVAAIIDGIARKRFNR